MNLCSIKLVFGVPEKVFPLRDAPPGKVRFRFRNGKFALVFIRTETGIRKFTVADNGDETWTPAYEQGRNERLREAA